ncbi:2-haloacrylate reductase [Aquicella siphonis]|uniref:NADPH:quinone reductase n=1 Tax=Aquicella siphonis TaxID=254247 RepID=A0A5E4PH47_9COXI|nr:quinone oxidoreductase [Aquicella siphonis]VVC75693.1 2-haloacrylate reductase [Aquicella siphonis]
MKAIRIMEYGETDALQLLEMPVPQPRAGEALVRLKTAGLNFIDIYMRKGVPRVALPVPFTPGREGAGIVEAIGDNVTDIKPGARVAFTGQVGSYAEYILVKAAELIPLPDDISFELGAAFPLQGMTAHYLTHDYYPVKAGDTVLVHAAAGGVGLLLVQWLNHMGARVIGTVSTEEKAETARAAGAHDIILYTQQDFVAETLKLTHGKGADYIIDGVGKTTFTKDLDAVRRMGWITLFGSASGPAEPLLPNSLQAKSITVSGGSLFNHIQSREDLLRRSRDVIDAIRAGWLKFKIDHVFPLAQASEAQHLLESRQTSGKVILSME